jgi:hypothetical protein
LNFSFDFAKLAKSGKRIARSVMSNGEALEPMQATVILERALHTPTEFSLSGEQVIKLRALYLRLQSSLIDYSAQISKADLQKYVDDQTQAASSVDEVIHNLVVARTSAEAQGASEAGQILSAQQYRDIVTAISKRPSLPHEHKEIAAQLEEILAKKFKDQKVVELETASLIADRLMSWAKLFAAAIAVPLALILAFFTVIGVSKYSDFTKMIGDAESKLKASVAQATTDADKLAQSVAALTQQQQQTDQQIKALTGDVSTIKEKLGFAPGGDVSSETQMRLERAFPPFQRYLIQLGYSPGSRQISVNVKPDLPGTTGYYSDNTIFLSSAVANDVELMYREYLHHVLYSKNNLAKVGPQCSAIESGLADYFVSSYTNSPKPYKVSGFQLDLTAENRFTDAKGHEDRYKVGAAWASVFWQLRQIGGQEPVDRAILQAWYEVSATPDSGLPARLIGAIKRRPEISAPDVQSKIEKVLLDRGFPKP